MEQIQRKTDYNKRKPHNMCHEDKELAHHHHHISSHSTEQSEFRLLMLIGYVVSMCITHSHTVLTEAQTIKKQDVDKAADSS